MRRTLFVVGTGAVLTLVIAWVWTAEPSTGTKREHPLTLGGSESSQSPAASTVPRVVDPALPKVAPSPEETPLAGLESTDADWVREQVAEHEAVKPLEPAQRAQLIAELVSIRQFAILERQEPIAPQDETNSEAPHE